MKPFLVVLLFIFAMAHAICWPLMTAFWLFVWPFCIDRVQIICCVSLMWASQVSCPLWKNYFLMMLKLFYSTMQCMLKCMFPSQNTQEKLLTVPTLKILFCSLVHKLKITMLTWQNNIARGSNSGPLKLKAGINPLCYAAPLLIKLQERMPIDFNTMTLCCLEKHVCNF